MLKQLACALAVTTLMASPVLAQSTGGDAATSGGATSGDVQGSEVPTTRGAGSPQEEMNGQTGADEQGTQGTEVPASDPMGTPQGSDLGTPETQIPAEPGLPQESMPGDDLSTPETQIPADQSGSQGTTPSDPGAEETAVPADTAMQLSGSVVRQVQDALNQQGFDAGSSDGILGPQTQSALRDFQAQQGMEATGQPSEETLSALGIQGGGQAPPQSQPQ